MRFHVMTLFPEMIENGMQTSIMGRAIKQGTISLKTINIRDFTTEKHGHVDDYPYGGGAGMVMQVEPIHKAYLSVCKSIPEAEKKPRVIYVTPQGKPFVQSMAEEFAKESDLIFLCGHYEGVDERAIELMVTDQVSIGDYVLTGGELPAMVMMDAISRLVPGVLNNDVSAEFETFHDDLLEYPQYTRPADYMDLKVPEVLLSGNHQKIEEWRLMQSRIRTKEARPDLYARYTELHAEELKKEEEKRRKRELRKAKKMKKMQSHE